MITQVADDKINSFGLRIFMKFQVGAAHPIPLTLEPLYQMAADKSAGTADQRPPIRSPELIPEGTMNCPWGPAVRALDAGKGGRHDGRGGRRRIAGEQVQVADRRVPQAERRSPGRPGSGRPDRTRKLAVPSPTRVSGGRRTDPRLIPDS